MDKDDSTPPLNIDAMDDEDEDDSAPAPFGRDDDDSDDGEQPGGLAQTLDRDGDGDHDMDDHDMERDSDDEGDDEDENKPEKEGFQDATTAPNPKYQDTDYMVNKLSGGLGRQQTMHKHSYKQGDNPMSMESVESIRESLSDLYKQYKAQ
jgi:hypothetical protein